MTTQYDVVIIGAGPGGYVGAIRASQLGLRVGVVEKQPFLGGTCLNWGCIPTKTLLEHAHVLKMCQNAGQWGITTGGETHPRIDMVQVQAHKDRIVRGLARGIEFLFKKNNIEWIKGTACLTDGGRVRVADGEAQLLQAKEIVVATGSRSRSVPGVTIDRQRIITSDEAIAFREVPKSMVVLGAGAVGVEFASIYNRFGSDVTIVELLPRLVPLEDEAVSAELEKSFRKQGIKVHTSAMVTRAVADADGVDIDVQLSDGSVERMRPDYLLVATGRAPASEGLCDEGVGLQLENGYIRVDDQLRTSVPGVSAVGDVVTLGRSGHPQLAHLSSAEGILVAERLAGRDTQPLNYDRVPSCTYCDPEIGSVGLTEREAAERGYDVRVGVFPLGVLGRARVAGETEGFVKIVSDKKYEEVLGVHSIGLRATELVAEATLALNLECTVEDLVRTIHAHPTMAEGMGEAAHAARGMAIHV